MAHQRATSIILSASVVAFALSLNVANAATKKKLTYEQAWAHCKALLDKEKAPGTTLAGNERFLRGGACMKHYGYTL